MNLRLNVSRCIKKGICPDTPEGVLRNQFMNRVRFWVRMYDLHGPDVLRHKPQNTEWTADKRMGIVAEVLAGNSIMSTAIKHGINVDQVYQWVRRYKIEGYNGLVDKPKGRKSKRKSMKKNNNDEHSKPLTPSEREELMRLRAEVEYMKAEVAAIKKERALRLERWDAALKAKKLKSSRNSKKKDTN